MSRVCSHCPLKFWISDSERGSRSIRPTCAARFLRNCPCAACREQGVVRHRRPQEIRQARGQGIFVYGRIPARILPNAHPLLTKQEAGGGQHGHHRLRHARLERLPRLRIHAFGQGRQPRQRFFLDRTPKRPAREIAQQIMRVCVTGHAADGRGFGENGPIVVRLHIILCVQRAAHGDFVDAQGQGCGCALPPASAAAPQTKAYARPPATFDRTCIEAACRPRG